MSTTPIPHPAPVVQPLTLFQTCKNAIQTHWTTIRTGLKQVSNAFSPHKPPQKPLHHPPPTPQPSAKRPRTTSSPYQSQPPSPFPPRTPQTFSRLPSPQNPFLPPPPRYNAQGLRSVLRQPPPSYRPDLSPAPKPQSSFPNLPRDKRLNLAIFRYHHPRPPPRRYSPLHTSLPPPSPTPAFSPGVRSYRPAFRSIPTRSVFTPGTLSTQPRQPPSRPEPPSILASAPLNRRILGKIHPVRTPLPVKRTLEKPPPRHHPLGSTIQKLAARQAGKVHISALAASKPPVAVNGTVPNVMANGFTTEDDPNHIDVFHEQPGLDARVLRENFPLELVELLESNPKFRRKILKQHGAVMANIVEAEVRRRERDAAIRMEEQRGTRIRARGEIAKGGLQKWVQRFLKPANQPEEPPADGKYMQEMYWSDEEEEWEEDDDALDERNRGVTVTKEDSAFAPLTDAALKRLRQTMTDMEYSDHPLNKIKGCIITGKDLARLRPGVWLNDEIVNAYLEMLAKRNEAVCEDDSVPTIRVMNSFFYTKLVMFIRSKGCSVYDYMRVRSWTRRFDAFSYDLMLIPINQSKTHWSLGVINFKEKTVQHLDSLGSGGSIKVRQHLMAWVRDEAADKKKPFDPAEWSMPQCDVPQQTNQDDCGVFLCKFADFLSRGWQSFTFEQKHMNYFRSRIAHELIMGRVA